MNSYLLDIGTAFMGFFAIMNPIANTPIFISLTSGDDASTKRAVARNALLLTFVLILAFSFAGSFIFQLFGITLPAFRITGGLLVFLIGFHMLQGEQSRVHQPSKSDQENSRQAQLSVAISPLAMPILAGPGTIATAMNFVGEGNGDSLMTTITAFFLLCCLTYAFFIFGERLIQYIGDSAINALTRLMGLILAVIGTQMFIDGARSLGSS